jgi:RNA recognition motif-containing protein
MNIYVGNLAYSVSAADLKAEFEKFGEVTSAEVIINRHTGRSRGYGFVKMADQAGGSAAVQALNGSEFHGRTMRVDESKPDTEKRSRTAVPRRGPAARHASHGARPRQAAAKDRAASKSGGLFGFVRNLFSRG